MENAIFFWGNNVALAVKREQVLEMKWRESLYLLTRSQPWLPFISCLVDGTLTSITYWLSAAYIITDVKSTSGNKSKIK